MSEFPSGDSFPDGPRDWCPRMEWSRDMIERIRAVIPKEMLVESGYVRIGGENGFPSRVVGQVYSYLKVLEGPLGLKSETCKVMFLVKFTHDVEDVSLGKNGSIHLGVGVSQLLEGLRPGYEYMADINPFKVRS